MRRVLRGTRFRASDPVDVNVVIRWKKGLPEHRDEPWFLITDLGKKSAIQLTELYGRRMGIEIKLPDVHRSDVEFTVEGPAIRFGLLAVKNVGQSAIESIVAAKRIDRSVSSRRRPRLRRPRPCPRRAAGG